MHRCITYALAVVVAGAALSAVGITEAGASGAATRTLQAVRASTAGASQALAIPGAQLWASRYSGSVNGQDEPFSMTVSPDGARVFVTGISTGASSGFATIAYSAGTGTQLWAGRYNGPANGEDGGYSVAVSPDGATVYVTGFSTMTATPATGQDYATLAYSAATGAHLWASLYNGTGNGQDFATSVAVSQATGTVFVTGQSDGISTGFDYATIAYSG